MHNSIDYYRQCTANLSTSSTAVHALRLYSTSSLLHLYACTVRLHCCISAQEPATQSNSCIHIIAGEDLH